MRESRCATCGSPIWREGRCVRCAPFGDGRFVELERWTFCKHGYLNGSHGCNDDED